MGLFDDPSPKGWSDMQEVARDASWAMKSADADIRKARGSLLDSRLTVAEREILAGQLARLIRGVRGLIMQIDPPKWTPDDVKILEAGPRM